MQARLADAGRFLRVEGFDALSSARVRPGGALACIGFGVEVPGVGQAGRAGIPSVRRQLDEMPGLRRAYAIPVLDTPVCCWGMRQNAVRISRRLGPAIRNCGGAPVMPEPAGEISVSFGVSMSKRMEASFIFWGGQMDEQSHVEQTGNSLRDTATLSKRRRSWQIVSL